MLGLLVCSLWYDGAVKRTLAILLAAFLVFLLAAPVVKAAPITNNPDLITQEVSFPGDDGSTFHGTVLTSSSAKSGRPGLVLVHGSGSGSSRTRLLPEAAAFAKQGFSVLIYDKRSVGYSGFKRSYSQLAGDALGAVHALRAQPGVDPAKVGLWGISEGGWVVPLAATRSDEVAFVVVVGANAIVPLQQQAWSDTSALRRHGVDGSLVNRAAPTMFRLLGDAGLFAEAHYDAASVLKQLKQPLLGIWGTNDLSTPPGENPPLFARALQEGSNTHFTFRFFEGADHAAHQTPDGGVTRLPLLAPGYAEAVGEWINATTSGQPPNADAPAPPKQAWASVSVPLLSWWESVWVQAGTLTLFLVAFAGYGLVALVRRLRRRTLRPIGGKAAGLLASTGIVVVFGSLLYLVFLFTDGAHDGAQGPVIIGRPLPWLVLQLLAIVTVVALAATIRNRWRASDPIRRGERLRLGLLIAGGIVFVPWAFYWGLLLP